MRNFLLDTNIFLEILLGQDKKEICKSFISDNISKLYLSDFSLHSIGVILFSNKKAEVFQKFINDIFPVIKVITLSKNKYLNITSLSEKYSLDFDDAYQAGIALEFDLEIVTMDKDFEKISNICKIHFL